MNKLNITSKKLTSIVRDKTPNSQQKTKEVSLAKESLLRKLHDCTQSDCGKCKTCPYLLEHGGQCEGCTFWFIPHDDLEVKG